MARRLSLLTVALVLTVGLAPRVTAEQASVASARGTAEKSYRGGRFDEVETVAKAFPKDEQIAVFQALSIAAKGDYARAESVLQPFAAANAAGDAALELGLLQLGIGKRTEGRRTLTLILMGDVANPSARDFLRAARASRALNRVDDAQSYFRDAIGLAPSDPRINTEWGDLFLEKYAKGDAAKSFQEALKTEPEYGPALAGMARALEDENPPQAAAFAERALKVNPNDFGARLVLANIAVYQDKKADVKSAIDAVLEVNPKHLEALSMRAAMAYVEGRDQEYQAAVDGGAEDPPDMRRDPPHCRLDHRALLPLHGRSSTRKAIALDKKRPRGRRPRRAVIAPVTSAMPAASRDGVPHRQVGRADLQHIEMLDRLSRASHGRRRDHPAAAGWSRP